MAVIETIKNNKKSVIAILSVALSTTLILCAFTGTNAGAAEQTTPLYRESTVTRGDIIVGVTETATATLKNHSLSFEVAGKIKEVFVKAGQEVKAGDSIVSMDTDSLQEELDTLEASYQEAALKLSDAQLAKQKGELDSKNTYDTTLNRSGTADTTYQMTVDKLESTLAQAEDGVYEIQREISTYKLILGYSFFDDDYTISYYYDEDYKESPKYDYQYDKDFENSWEVEDAIDNAEKRLSAAQATLTQAQYNLEIQMSESGLTKNQTVSNAQLADDVYKMELQSLANSVSSKQLSLQNIQDQIDKYNGYIKDNILYAPCDGIVTAVSATEGDQAQAQTAIATISDSANVFVYVTIAQDDIANIAMGQSASLVMDAFENQNFEGVVDSITTTPARSASGTASYNVTIKVKGDTAKIFEGMTGTATLITRQQKNVLYVTNRTIYQKDGASYLKVKREDSTIEEVAVTTGFSDGRNVEITEGVEEGWTVLIESQVATQ